MFLINDYVVFIVVIAAVIVVDFTAAEFDVVASAVVDVVFFHLVFVVLFLFVFAAVISDFEIDDGYSAVA